MIVPKVAMQLWYQPFPDERVYAEADQAFTAVITHVFSNSMVNLIILNELGEPIRKSSVTLAQGVPAQPGECEWAPHQLRQAVFQNALESAMTTLAALQPQQ